MRLGIKLLNSDASANSLKAIEQIKVAGGETLDILVQLVDLDQAGLRYIPDSAATVRVQMPRLPYAVPDINNTRKTVDNSIDAPATKPFAGDSSIWKISLTADDTANKLVSTAIRVVVTEGTSVKIATLNSAIKKIDGQDF